MYKQKCCLCHQPITDIYDSYYFGLDGDLVHINCQIAMNERIKKINNMSDNEFELWLMEGCEVG
jgi:hypothetical protein